VFEDNSGYYPGLLSGILAFDALFECCSPIIVDCRFDGGNTPGLGLGIDTMGSLTLERCRLTGMAPALEIRASQVTMRGCLFADNYDAGSVTAYLPTRQVSISNCTLANNGSGWSFDANVAMDGCITWDTPWFLYYPLWNTISLSYSNLPPALALPGPGNISTDPLFRNPAAQDYHLLAHSPCRDAGDPWASNLLPVDLDGTPRIAGVAVDMGADEIPVALWPGSGEDLDLAVFAPGISDPLLSVVPAEPADLLRVELASWGGTFAAAPALLLGQLYPTGSPFPNAAGIAQLHIDFLHPFGVMYAAMGLSPFASPGLASGGVQLYYLIPPGLSNSTLRMQLFAISGAAANGSFAASDARDVEFL
jgi:hypothetical protein